MLLIFLCTLCFIKFFIQVLYHPYILHWRMFALISYHRHFAKIFVNFMWFSVKNQKTNSIKKIKKSILTLLAGNTQYILSALTTFAYIPACLTWTRVEVRQCYHSSYVVCVVVFILGIVLTIIICIIWQNVILLVVCRSWNHNIDASLCITKVLIWLTV